MWKYILAASIGAVAGAIPAYYVGKTVGWLSGSPTGEFKLPFLSEPEPTTPDESIRQAVASTDLIGRTFAETGSGFSASGYSQ